MANLYYREDLADDDFEPGATVEVIGDEARHAVKVSRLRLGERIMVGNGAGALGTGEVVVADRDRFAVRLDEAGFAPSVTPSIVLVQALAKGDRDERAVEQATEFGVDRIMPWQAARSVSRWDGPGGEKSLKGIAKWQRIAREAAKQSLRPRIPAVAGPLIVADLCREAEAGALVLVLHPSGEHRLSEFAATGALNDSVAEVYLVVGPEGGFSDDELAALNAAGARILVLGETVLRTSSAGPAAIAVLNTALGRW